MRRGDVVLVDLDPARSDEAAKRRPCVVVSNEGANRAVDRHGRGVVTIVPLTSNVGRVFDAFQVLVADGVDLAVMGLGRPSKLQAEQVRSVSASRVAAAVGRCPSGVLEALDDALRFHLSL